MRLTVDDAIAGLDADLARHAPALHEMYAELIGVGPQTIPLLLFLNRHLAAWGVRGGVCEIGVMQGVYLIVLSKLAADDEPVIAIDLFEEQALNVDQSGISNTPMVERNLDKYVPHPERVRLVQGDSTSFHSHARLARLAADCGEIKVFSVDGCHTKQHTMADIELGAQLLANGGLLIIDDYTNDGWAGVADGTATYFATRNIRLAPLVACFNKLVCTTISHREIYFEAIREWTATASFARHYGHSKVVHFYEHPVWHLNLYAGI